MEFLLLARLVILAFVAYSAVPPAEAVTGSVSLLYGEGYKTPDYDRFTYRVDITDIGKNHLFVARTDVSNMDSDSTAINTRLIGHYFNTVHIAAQLQNASKTNIGSLGGGVTYTGTNYYGFTDLYVTNTNFDGNGYHVFSYVKLNLPLDFYVDSYVDWLNYATETNTTLSQIALTRKFGQLEVGVEQQLYYNKARVKGLDESVTQFKLKYVF